MVKKSSPGNEFRKKAESRLRRKSMIEDPETGTDPARLVHELQVHQIELELQNEELRMQKDKAEEATRRYSDLYSEIYDFTPVAYFSLSPDGEILELNLRGCELLGADRTKLLNRNFKFFLSNDSRQVFSRFLTELFADLRRKKCEVQIVRNDSLVYSIIECAVSENADKCLVMATDITDLKQAGKALIESEQRLHSLVMASSELLYIMNPDWSEMLQLNSKGFLANTEKPNKNWLRDYIPTSDHNVVIVAINEAIRNKTGFELEHRVNQANGSVGWVYSRAIPMINSIGEISEWFGAASNITARKDADTEQKLAHEKLKKNQAQLRKAKLALEQSKKKLTIALENGKIGLWEWDIAKNITIWDRRMEEMFGLEPGTFDGKFTTLENLVHEDDLSQMRIKMERALAEESYMEAVYRTKERNGKSNYILSKAVIIRDRMNRPVNVTGVCFDVTRIQEGAEKHIVKLNEELLRSNSDLRQFAYIASHDLQEPLRMVTSFTQLLQLQYNDKLDEKANEYINFAVDGSKRMYELLNGLLAYSRIQTRGSGFEEINLETVVQKVRENLRLLIEETAAEITAGKFPVVNADENQMIQLMQNLIENSIKFCKRKPTIHISSRLENGMHIISVRDNGIGIEPQYYERIFLIFQRLHLRDQYRGTGVGLAVSKKIVERHGGELWVESVPEEGSVFNFSLPANMHK